MFCKLQKQTVEFKRNNISCKSNNNSEVYNIQLLLKAPYFITFLFGVTWRKTNTYVNDGNTPWAIT